MRAGRGIPLSWQRKVESRKGIRRFREGLEIGLLNVIGMIQIEGESWTSAIASILIADEKQEVRICYRGIFKGYGVATEGEALSSEAGFKRGFTIKYSCHWDCS